MQAAGPFRAVILVGPFPPPVHGISTINAKMVSAFVARGLRHYAINIAPGKFERDLSYHLTRVWRTLVGAIRILALSKKRQKYSIVVAIDGGLGIAYNLLFAIIARFKRFPLTLYHHTNTYTFNGSLLMQLLTRVAGSEAIHVMCSKAMAEIFLARFPAAQRTHLISNAAWVDLPSCVPNPGSGILTLGHLGGLNRQKGLLFVFATLRTALRSGVAARLLLGGLPTSALDKEILKAGLQEFAGHIEWRGVMLGADKDIFYSELDYFLFPSLLPETQTLVVPEAMASGVPVIAYDQQFMNEFVESDGGHIIPRTLSFAQEAVNWIMAAGDGELEERKRKTRARFIYMKQLAKDDLDRFIQLVATRN